MTTINIPGKITAIEVDETAGGFGYAEYTGGVSGSPTTIDPTGEKLSVFKLHSPTVSDGSGGFVVASSFQLASSFDIGDVVEIISDGTGFVVTGVNGVVAVTPPISPNNAVRCRKIASGTTLNWVVS